MSDIHGMPQPVNINGLTYGQRLLAQESLYDRAQCRADYERRLQSLNVEQRAVWDAIKPAIDNALPLCAFIDGRAGTGKTFLYNLILAYTRSEDHILLLRWRLLAWLPCFLKVVAPLILGSNCLWM